MTKLNLPFSIRAQNRPSEWTVLEYDDRNEPRLIDRQLVKGLSLQLDIYELRKKFLSLTTPSEMLSFLRETGNFDVVESRNMDFYFRVQELIRVMLTRPIASLNSNNPIFRALNLRFDSQRYTTVASIEIGAQNGKLHTRILLPGTYRALLISALVDRIQLNRKFKICERPDCQEIFESRPGKKYHEWYCGHFESVRRGRMKDRKEKLSRRMKKV
jgi:hypothetical protein